MFLTLFLLPPQVLAERDRVIISDPSLRKIPIAIPLFRVQPHHSEMSRKGAELCSELLDFTGYFKILDRGAFLPDAQNIDITGANINFQNWMSIGADLLLTAGIQMENNEIDSEFRLFDPLKSQLLVGKRYKGWKGDLPKMTRRFCSEVIYYLTGTRGVFETKIAFVSTGSGNKEIYLCDFDGQNSKQFTHNGNITLFPDWSGDGKWLAYTSYAKGRPDIYIRHLKEKRGAVISNKGINSTPAWVPGTFSLAATLSFEGDQDIYLLTGKGKIIRKLTRNNGIDTSPAWSPDGNRMAFVSNRSGTPQIYVMHVGSGKVERLTFQGKYNTQPSWSPKGDKVVYSSRSKSGRHNICTIGLGRGGTARLTRGAGDNESPSWSPDGSMIVFSSTRGGPSRIYVMSAHGTDQRRLLSLPGQQTNPKWSPDGMNN